MAPTIHFNFRDKEGERMSITQEQQRIKSLLIGNRVLADIQNRDQWRTARRNYGYPRVGLAGKVNLPGRLDFAATSALDTHHYNLLRSDDDERIVLGYLSTIYWGFFSGQDGRHRGARAMGKVHLARDGKTYLRKGLPIILQGVSCIGIRNVAREMRSAAVSLDTGDTTGALTRLLQLPGLGIAFASKICAFLDPHRCGVIDTVIARRFPELNVFVRRNVVCNTLANRLLYANYCVALESISADLNAFGPAAHWIDCDGQHYSWRAVDVERALYHG